MGVGVASMCMMEKWQIGAEVGRGEREPCTRTDKKVDKMDITLKDGLQESKGLNQGTKPG